MRKGTIKIVQDTLRVNKFEPMVMARLWGRDVIMTAEQANAVLGENDSEVVGML